MVVVLQAGTAGHMQEPSLGKGHETKLFNNLMPFLFSEKAVLPSVTHMEKCKRFSTNLYD